MKKTGAVLLAAGMSSRMGAFKPMLPFGNTTVIRHTIDKLQSLKLSPIVVVTGFKSDELTAHLFNTGVRFLKNERYQSTQTFESARIAIESIKDECDQFLILPADLPAIMPATFKKIMKEKASLARPTCNGEPGHPVLMSCETAVRLCSYKGDGGLQKAIRHFGFPVRLIEVEDEGVYRDMDTWDQYQELLKWTGEKGYYYPISPRVTLRLVADEAFYGPGVQELLFEIRQNGSLQKACMAMNMSYSKGARMIKNLERCTGQSIVERYAGGSGGGGSRLTEKGLELLQKYDAVVTEVQTCAEIIFQKHFHCGL